MRPDSAEWGGGAPRRLAAEFDDCGCSSIWGCRGGCTYADSASSAHARGMQEAWLLKLIDPWQLSNSHATADLRAIPSMAALGQNCCLDRHMCIGTARVGHDAFASWPAATRTYRSVMSSPSKRLGAIPATVATTSAWRRT